MRKSFILMAGLALFALSCNKNNSEGGGEEGGGTVTLLRPEGLSATTTETSATVSWSAVGGAQGYAYRLTKDAQIVSSGSVTALQVKIDGLSAATTYSFQVQATAGSVKSAYSESLRVTTQDSGEDPGEDPSEAPASYEDFQIPAQEENLGALAFPGAQGGGMFTTGGRGGEVYHVTTLNDSGKGSLRDGIENRTKDSGGNYVPRTIVFDVAGIIALSKALKVEKGNLTIAGQTAPGDGICLKDYNFRIAASNVIVRFLRFRMGDETKTADDALQLYTGDNNIYDVIIDHCSLSWSTDECGSFYGMTNFSLQWCILSESLLNSVHGKGRHGYGGIWGGSNSTFHHNLLAHHFSRNPRLDHDYVSTLKGPLNFVNNVIYNWGDNSSYGGESRPGSDFKKYNIVNNYYKPGPATTADKVRFLDPTTKCTYCDSSHPDQVVPGHFYMTGNFMHGNEGYSADNWSGKATTASAELIATIKADSFFPYEKASYLSLHSAENAFTSVVGYAGASLKRDSVDERIVKETKNGTFTYKGSNGGDKGFIDSQADVGGWPKYEGITRSGLPAWVGEPNDYTLDPKQRYTNLEMYLHYLVREIVAKQNENASYTNQQ